MILNPDLAGIQVCFENIVDFNRDHYSGDIFLVFRPCW